MRQPVVDDPGDQRAVRLGLRLPLDHRGDRQDLVRRVVGGDAGRAGGDLLLGADPLHLLGHPGDDLALAVGVVHAVGRREQQALHARDPCRAERRRDRRVVGGGDELVDGELRELVGQTGADLTQRETLREGDLDERLLGRRAQAGEHVADVIARRQPVVARRHRRARRGRRRSARRTPAFSTMPSSSSRSLSASRFSPSAMTNSTGPPTSPGALAWRMYHQP